MLIIAHSPSSVKRNGGNMAKKQDKQPKEAATAAGRPWNISPEVTKETLISWIKWMLSYADKEETAFIYHCISAYLARPGRNSRFAEDGKE